MTAWIASGRVLDLILVGMALEAAVLLALWRTSRRGVRPGDLLPNLFSGMCLLLAMRVGLTGGWWGWVCLPLFGALLLHVTDLRRRWISPKTAGTASNPLPLREGRKRVPPL